MNTTKESAAQTQFKFMHTPGYWHVGMNPGPIVYGPKGEQIADLTADLLPREETKANARLIAAAPDLLALATWMLDMRTKGHGLAGWDDKAKEVLGKLSSGQT